MNFVNLILTGCERVGNGRDPILFYGFGGVPKRTADFSPDSYACGMPWSCPACFTRSRTAPTKSAPCPGVIYRCYVCRLELQLNQQADRLELVLLPDALNATASSGLTQFRPVTDSARRRVASRSARRIQSARSTRGAGVREGRVAASSRAGRGHPRIDRVDRARSARFLFSVMSFISSRFLNCPATRVGSSIN